MFKRIFFIDKAELAERMSYSSGPYQNIFCFGLASVTYALVCKGDGLESPFSVDTGPTGWSAPGMVMVYALAFALFGWHSLSLIFILVLFLSGTLNRHNYLLATAIICTAGGYFFYWPPSRYVTGPGIVFYVFPCLLFCPRMGS